MFNQIKITTSLVILIVIFVSLHLFSSISSVIRSNNNDINFSKTVLLNEQLDSLGFIRQEIVQSRLESYRAASSLIEENQAQFEIDFNNALLRLNASKKEMDLFMAIENPLDTNHELISLIHSTYLTLHEDIRKQLAALKNNGFQAFRRIDIAKLQEDFSEKADNFLQQVSDELNMYNNLSGEVNRNTLIQTVVEAMILFTVFLIALWWTHQVVKKPLDNLIVHFNYIANGQLSNTPSYSGKNEISMLFTYFEKMREYLINTVQVVRDSSHMMTLGVESMAKRNDELSARTEEQASALQETAASMEELTSTVRLNAENAQTASSLAEHSTQTAMKGGELTKTVVKTMGDISDSSEKIGAILTVLEGIAFQTNILALNAAVEAARAGEKGRGFAVVAGEVRNLAQKSANEAKEIKGLIDESLERVSLGVRLVKDAGNTMNEIVESVSQVNRLMTDISSASFQQSKGIELISVAINQMDNATAENGMLVYELSDSAKKLEQQATELSTAVSLFSLNDSVHSDHEQTINNLDRLKAQ